MDELTIKLIADVSLSYASSSAYVDWAIAQLESGRDTRNIKILASLPKPPFTFEAEGYFHQALDELGWSYPDDAALFWGYLRLLAREIVTGSVDPVQGCHKIYKIYFALDYPEVLSSFVDLDNGLAPGTYVDLQGETWCKAIIDEAARLAAALGQTPTAGDRPDDAPN